jgi:hypothetical protein
MANGIPGILARNSNLKKSLMLTKNYPSGPIGIMK